MAKARNSCFWIIVFSTLWATTTLGQDVLFLTNGADLHLSANATLYVYGGVLISDGGGIDNYGEINLNDNNTVGTSNWTDQTASGVFGSSNGTVHLKGNHTLNQGRFYDLVASTSGQIKLASDVTIQNQLILTEGIFVTDQYHVEIQSSLSGNLLAGAGNGDFKKSFVRGNLKRSIASNNATYSFPVGKISAPQSNPVHLVNNGLTGVTQLTVSFANKNGNDMGLDIQEFNQDYNSINSFGIWSIEGDAAPTAGSFDLHASLSNFAGLLDNSFALVTRPKGSVSAADWFVPLNSTIPGIDLIGRTVLGGVAIRSNISVLGEFGIGEVLNPLPLTLLEFSGEANGATNELTWTSANEINVDYFSIRKSWNDADDFQEIGRVKAKNENFSEVQKYQFVDPHVLPGKSYYFLKMVDMDRSASFSNVVVIQRISKEMVVVSPKPAEDWLMITLAPETTGLDQITIFDLAGKIQTEQTFPTETHFQLEVDLRGFSPGLYIVKTCDRKTFCYTQKFLKIK